MFLLTNEIVFPPQYLADEHGLLAIGGDLCTERLLLAYQNGIFPWYNEGEVIQWYCPDPRFVLFPEQLKISRSMQTVLNNGRFRFTINRAFSQVITSCMQITRKDQDGSWIHDDVIHAYTKLHEKGMAVSAEAWHNGKLAGGLYGIKMGNVFFGESMFSRESNASKFAFIRFVQQFEKENGCLVDCQVYTGHLASLGAEMIPREQFLQLLKKETVY